MTQSPRSDLASSLFVVPDRKEAYAAPSLSPRFIGSDGRPGDVQVVGHGVDGRETEIEAEMAAKRVESGHVAQFFVRYSTASGKPLDPASRSFKTDDLRKGRKLRGRLLYEFRETHPQAYAAYLLYLKDPSAGLLAEMERIQNA